MKRVSWKLAVVATAVGSVAVTGAIWAKAASEGTPHQKLPRRPAISSQGPLAPAVIAQKTARIQARKLIGTLILFEYDSGLTKDLDLDDNGTVQDNGDRVLFQGTVWLSNRLGAKLSNVGRFASFYDYLDVSGESTGTDLVQNTDILIANHGQIRAGGFWNVEDGVGDPAIPILGATGTNYTMRYKSGQLLFLGEVQEGQELYFLAR
jgi:hypothetical protein